MTSPKFSLVLITSTPQKHAARTLVHLLKVKSRLYTFFRFKTCGVPKELWKMMRLVPGQKDLIKMMKSSIQLGICASLMRLMKELRATWVTLYFQTFLPTSRFSYLVHRSTFCISTRRRIFTLGITSWSRRRNSIGTNATLGCQTHTLNYQQSVYLPTTSTPL